MALVTQTTFVTGSFDADRRFISPKGAVEVGLQQDVAGALRLGPHLQLWFSMPFVETYRKVTSLSEIGGGLGDLRLGSRFEFTQSSEKLPGLALSTSIVVPSGVAPESAKKPLATDATGTGALALSAAFSVEKTLGGFVMSATGTVTWRETRYLPSLREQRGVEIGAFGAAGWSFASGVVLMGTLAYNAELSASLNGARVPGTGRAATRLGLSGGYAITADWRVWGSFAGDLPIRWLGQGQPVNVGLQLAILRTFS